MCIIDGLHLWQVSLPACQVKLSLWWSWMTHCYSKSKKTIRLASFYLKSALQPTELLLQICNPVRILIRGLWQTVLVWIFNVERRIWWFFLYIGLHLVTAHKIHRLVNDFITNGGSICMVCINVIWHVIMIIILSILSDTMFNFTLMIKNQYSAEHDHKRT